MAWVQVVFSFGAQIGGCQQPGGGARRHPMHVPAQRNVSFIRSVSRRHAWHGLLVGLGLGWGAAVSVAGPLEVTLQATQAKALGVQAQRIEPISQVVTELPGLLSLPVRAQQVVSAPLDGLVTAVLVDEGDAVRAGQPLLKLRSAQLPLLQKEHRQAAGQLALAERGLRRDEQLYAEGLIAAARLEQSRHDVQMAGLVASQQRQLLGQALAGAGVDAVGDVVIQATAAMQVTDRMVEIGQRVQAAMPLFKLARLDELLVDVSVTPALARQVVPGSALWVDSGDGADLKGQVMSVGARVNEGNQGVLVRASLKPSPRSPLKPGQWVTVRMALAGRAHRVPEAALVSMSRGGEGVFVARAAGRYELRSVVVMGRQAAQATVSVSGLNDDETVVVKGTAALKALLP